MRIRTRVMWWPAATLVLTSALTGAVLTLNDSARAVITPARPGAWMASAEAGSISHVGPDGVDATVALKQSSGALRVIQVDGVAYVTDADGRLSRVDPVQLEVSQEALLPSSSARLVAGGGRLYAVDPTVGTVRELDPVQLTSIGQPLALGPSLGSAVVDPTGVLWVADTATGEVVPVDGRTVGERRRVSSPGADVKLSVVGTDVVAVDPSNGTATVVSGPAPSTPRQVPTTSDGEVELPDNVGEGSVLPILTGGRTLTLLHVRSGDARTVALPTAGHQLGTPRLSGGRVYVPDFTAGAVVVVDVATATVLSTVTVTGRPGEFEVLVDGTSVYLNDPRSERAWTLRPSGELVPATKYDPTSPKGGGGTRTVVPPAPDLPAPPTGGDEAAAPPPAPPMPTTTTTTARRDGEGDGDGRGEDDETTTTTRATAPPTTGVRTITPTSVASNPSGTRPGNGGGGGAPVTVVGPGNGPTTTGPDSTPAPSGDGAVTNVVVVAGDRQVTVSWAAPAGWNTVTGYTVTARASNGGAVPNPVKARGDATSVTVRPLDNGRSYTFAVMAESRRGDGRTVVSDAVVPSRDAPPAPTNLAVTPGDGQVDVRWSWGGGTIDGFGVQIVDAQGANVATRSLAAGTTSATFTGLPNGAELRARVYATVVDGGATVTGQPATSSPFVTRGRPSAPGSVIAAVTGNGQARVSWMPAGANGSPITGYAITAAPVGSGAPVSLPNIAGDATQAEVNGLVVGARYAFHVTATNAYGTASASSAPVLIEFSDPPGAPGAVTATAGYHAVTVTWTPADGNGTTVANYVVRNLCDSTSRVAAATATTLDFDGLTPGASCRFDVRAVGTNGAEGLSAATPAAVTVLGTTAPSAVAVTAVGAVTVSLAVTQPPATGPAIGRWRVTTSPDTGVREFTTTAITLDGLATETAYTVTVVAVDAAGGVSAPATASTTTASLRPAAPANFRVLVRLGTPSTGRLRVTFDWDLSAGATGYRLVRTAGAPALDLTVGTSTWNVFGDDATHTATLVAYNAYGESAPVTVDFELPYYDPIDNGCPNKPYVCPLP